MLANLNTFSFLNKWKKKKKSVQRNILETDNELAYLMKQLQQHLVIITAKFSSDPEIYNTSIIKVDYKNKLFYLDELVPDTGNAQIKTLQKIRLSTRLDGTILTMECRLKEPGNDNNLPHYVMYFPTRARSIQRRESYRVNIPLNKRLQITMQTDSGHFIAGFLNDISYSGVSMRLESSQAFELNPGDFVPFLTIHLNETITCEMEVRRISTTRGHIIISGQLEEISIAHQKEIQTFISRLDREKRRNAAGSGSG